MRELYLVDIRRGDEMERLFAETEEQVLEYLRPVAGRADLEYLRVERIKSVQEEAKHGSAP